MNVLSLPFKAGTLTIKVGSTAFAGEALKLKRGTNVIESAAFDRVLKISFCALVGVVRKLPNRHTCKHRSPKH